MVFSHLFLFNLYYNHVKIEKQLFTKLGIGRCLLHCKLFDSRSHAHFVTVHYFGMYLACPFLCGKHRVVLVHQWARQITVSIPVFRACLINNYCQLLSTFYEEGTMIDCIQRYLLPLSIRVLSVVGLYFLLCWHQVCPLGFPWPIKC